MAKSITEVLGIKYPIIQGGMAWISDAKLAAAVSNAGGAGIISCGGRTTEYVREEIRKAKQLTDKPFGVNVMLMAPNKDEIVDVICEEKPVLGPAFAMDNTPGPSCLKSLWNSSLIV